MTRKAWLEDREWAARKGKESSSCVDKMREAKRMAAWCMVTMSMKEWIITVRGKHQTINGGYRVSWMIMVCVHVSVIQSVSLNKAVLCSSQYRLSSVHWILPKKEESGRKSSRLDNLQEISHFASKLMMAAYFQAIQEFMYFLIQPSNLIKHALMWFFFLPYAQSAQHKGVWYDHDPVPSNA